ncbi:MAG: tRNA uridine-5-carboxymethylaminomethyl(34) synthesis GTPase MnmE [Clostridiales bacterium]|nr:tRNA uridine-5-carboxymethylaminomethyl(34) synthesis GTPase MnmE [Clostridiales bacterium]
MNERTIAAISTPVGVGGVSVIRVSGSDAVSCADRIFKGGSKLCDVPSHTVHYGHIVDRKGKAVDEVLVTVMRAPRTYTREDVVEISTHGGIIASKKVMECLISCGVFPAGPGEFTKRAFLNGRIDLSQAEGVIDIINAKTSLAQQNALSQAEGGLSDAIGTLRENLVHLAAQMQVAIDYPDEDLEDITTENILSALSNVKESIEHLIGTSENGKIITRGIRTAIIGKPNVGKSSLLNRLAREDRAIVTDIAGTTRDVIEELVNLNGIPLRLMDTAGIHDTEDVVEKIGVERSVRAADEADLVILVLDISREIDGEDKTLIALTENKKRIIVANKSDKKLVSYDGAIEISTVTGEGIEDIAAEIKSMYGLGEIGLDDSVIITNMRHLAALSSADEAIQRALVSVKEGMPQDFAALDINETIQYLGEITGDTVSEDIVTDIFHNFCVGK